MSSPRRAVRLGILGAGGRGSDAYGRWILAHPDRARIAAVADPLPSRREALADAAELADEARFSDWRDLLDRSSMLALDAVVVALPDRDHVDPTLAACRAGLDVLVEKPVAPTPEELSRLRTGVEDTAGRVTVAHVLRFSPFWATVAALVAAGRLGRLATIRQEENIGYWHFAHSYVRGNWRRADTASPIVLAKTCHDLDLIRWLAGEPPTTVTSRGSLLHFTSEHAPPHAPDRCLDGCVHADSCPFYAPRYYVDALADESGWPVALLGPDTTVQGRLDALRTGPYGRCVYHSDNDVPDHQQTLLEFTSGLTATLTTSAFTGRNTRTLQLTGTRGELTGDMESGRLRLDVFDPTLTLPELPRARHVETSRRGPLGHRSHTLGVDEGAAGSTVDHRGHGGGDDGLMDAFVTAVRHRRPAPGGSLDDAVDSHLMAFAADRSRHTGHPVAPTILDPDQGPDDHRD